MSYSASNDLTTTKDIFFLLERFSEEEFTILSSRYADERRRKKISDLFLNIFNNGTMAHEYVVWLKQKAGISKPVQVAHILNQSQWDFVRNTVTKENITTGVLNACKSENHFCPILSFDLNRYADFEKLNEWSSAMPCEHFTLQMEGKPESVVL